MRQKVKCAVTETPNDTSTADGLDRSSLSQTHEERLTDLHSEAGMLPRVETWRVGTCGAALAIHPFGADLCDRIPPHSYNLMDRSLRYFQ